MSSESAAAQIAEEAGQSGLNSLIVQVRGRGDAWYSSAIEPRPVNLTDPTFDPLDAMLEQALARGLWVHAWVNAALVGGPHPDSRHLSSSHPEWLMLPSELATALLRLRPDEPQYLTRLTEWASTHESEIEGLYADPSDPAYRAYFVTLCRDLVSRYPLDGLHLDYIRYPGAQWGYTKAALAGFCKAIDAELRPKDRADMARRVASDPLAYTKRYSARWSAYRREAVTQLVKEVSKAVRSERPGMVMSAAVFPDITDARNSVLQDWTRWLEEGWIDVACPMIYTKNRKTFNAQLNAALRAKAQGRIWAGIGAWQIAEADTCDRIRLARAAGAEGIVLFSHGHLQRQPGLFEKLRAGPFAGT